MEFLLVDDKTIYANKNNGSLPSQCPFAVLSDLSCFANCEVGCIYKVKIIEFRIIILSIIEKNWGGGG